MRVLVTGISGFIGGCLSSTVPAGIDLWGTHLHHPHQRLSSQFIRLNLEDSGLVITVIEGIRPDVIIHTAAYSRAAYCETNPLTAWKLNVEVVESLAQLARERRMRLIFLSSDMVFDGSKGQYSEEDPPNPINIYGWTKWAAEQAVLALGSLGVVVRVNLTYGKPKLGGTSFSEEVIQTVTSGKPYFLFADQFRSFLSVLNLAHCLWELVDSDFSGLLHLGGSESLDRYTFGVKLAHHLGLDARLLRSSAVKEHPSVVRHPLVNTFALTRAQEVLKTRLWNLEEGLSQEYQ